MIINAITYGVTTIQFPAAPLRESEDTPDLVQTSGLASDGGLYVYNKALHYRISRRLTYTQVSDSILAALRTLYADLDGARNLFTWYDHLGPDYYSGDYYSADYMAGGHNCRFSGPIQHTQTGPSRNRVEFELEELIPLSMPSAASWAAASGAVSGSFPCWIFRLTVNGVDYWLSDHTFDVPGFCPATLALVKSWGQIQSGVTGGLDEYKVSDFSIDLLIDPDTSPNLRDLSLLYEFEQYPVELYLWFHGLNAVTDPPRLKWRGYVRNHPEMDDTTLRLECEDETARLSKNIGTLLDVRTYPEAAKADVGKMFPIVFGDVRRLPLLGIDVGPQTTLPNAISAATTSFDLSDATDLAGTVIVIDDEHILITEVAGNTVGVTRGINNTLAATHSRGAVAWEFREEYLYACEAVDAISQVYGKAAEYYLNITSICTRYTGLAGNQHPDYPGLAVISLPGVVTLDQLAGLSVSDTLGITENIGVEENIGSTLAGNIQDYLLYREGNAYKDGNIRDYAVTDPTHTHGTPTSRSQANSDTGTVYGGTGSSSVSVSPAFPSVSGVIEQTNSYVFSYGGNAVAKNVYVNGVLIQSGFSSGSNVTWTGTTVGLPQILVTCGSTNVTVTMGACTRSVLYYDTTQATAPGVSKTAADNGTLFVSDTISITKTPANNGTLSVSDNIVITKTAANNGTLTASRTGPMAVRTGAPTARTGVISLIGTTSLKSVLSLSIYADCSRNTFLPSAVGQDILTRADGGALTTVGTFPLNYRLDGAITEYKPAQYWLDYFAFQCRAWFVKSCGVAKLIVRPDQLTSIKTLPNCLLNGNKRSLKISKAPLSEVINVMALRYDRDYSQSRSAENYRGCITERMAESIGYYGEREAGQPEMFWFDFVRDLNMAIAVMGYYLYKHSRRHRLYHFTVALDSESLQFADAITLGFEGNKQVEIVAADLTPGDKSRLDTLAITATDIHTEWPYMSTTDYYSEDYLLSHL